MPGNIFLLITLLAPVSRAIRLKVSKRDIRLARSHIDDRVTRPANAVVYGRSEEEIEKRVEATVEHLVQQEPSAEDMQKFDQLCADGPVAKLKEWTVALDLKIKSCPSWPGTIGVALSEAGVPFAKGMMSVIVHMLDMLHDDSWMGSTDENNGAAGRVIRRFHRMTLVVMDFAAKEELIERKDCIPEDNITVPVTRWQFLTFKCVMTIFVAVLNQAASEYLGGLIAITVGILKDMIKAYHKIQELHAGQQYIGPGCWLLTIHFARLVTFTSLGISLGKGVGNIAQSFLKNYGEHAAANKQGWYDAVSKFVANMIEGPDAKAATLMAHQHYPALGEACVNRVAHDAFLYGPDFTSLLTLNRTEDVLAPQQWWQGGEETDDENDHIRKVLNSFIRQTWTPKSGRTPGQKQYWKIIQERYARLYEKTAEEPTAFLRTEASDIGIPDIGQVDGDVIHADLLEATYANLVKIWGFPSNHLSRREMICKAAHQACANKATPAGWILDQDKGIVALPVPYFSSSSAIIQCCLTSRDNPRCNGWF